MFVRLILAALLVPSAGAAEAQINPFRNVRGTRLDSSDTALMNQAARRLLGPEAPAIGTVENWSNPKTGASGTVAYVGPTAPTVRGGMQACRKLRYEASTKNQQNTRRLDLEWCRQPDGTWKNR